MKMRSRSLVIASILVLASSQVAVSGSNGVSLLLDKPSTNSSRLILTKSQLSCEAALNQCQDDCGSGDPPGCASMPGGCGAQKPTPKWKRCIAACNERIQC